MKLGKLNYIYNLDKHQAANKGYYHALVFDAMKKIRERSRKNPEDAVQPSWFDMIIATIRLY